MKACAVCGTATKFTLCNRHEAMYRAGFVALVEGGPDEPIRRVLHVSEDWWSRVIAGNPLDERGRLIRVFYCEDEEVFDLLKGGMDGSHAHC
jgi:hypothetical protein